MALKIDIVEKKFDSKIIFKDFHYEFPDTGVFALFADSGTGKTTLLRMIAGLDKKFKGTIDGGGAANVSVSFQEYRLFPDISALMNVACVYDEKDSDVLIRAKEILLDLGISEKDQNLLPSELSGGMKQRVSIARAIMKKTPVLLLDEPTKELDKALCETLYRVMIDEAKSRLVIMVTHSEDDIEATNATVIKI